MDLPKDHGLSDEILSAGVVSIYVGPASNQFFVHSSLITSQSKYFDRALNGGWRESEEGSIYFPEEEPTVIAFMILWLYKGVIPGIDAGISPFACLRSNEMPTIKPTRPPLPPGTSEPFRNTVEYFSSLRSVPELELVLHICSDTIRYHDFSPEELRLADYRAGRRYGQLERGLAEQNNQPEFIPFIGSSIPPKDDFGSESSIVYPNYFGTPLNGIPLSKTLGSLLEERVANQDVLLNLCVFAETICWPELFNAAIVAYVRGEHNLYRDIPFEHVDLIYERTHPNSTLRRLAFDFIRCLTKPETSYKFYLPLAQQHEALLDNIFMNFSKRQLGEKIELFAMGFDKIGNRQLMAQDNRYLMPLDGTTAPKRDILTAGEEHRTERGTKEVCGDEMEFEWDRLNEWDHQSQRSRRYSM